MRVTKEHALFPRSYHESIKDVINIEFNESSFFKYIYLVQIS